MPLHNEEYAIEQNSRHTHLSLRHCILLFLFHNRRNTCLEFLFLSFLSIIFHELKSFHLFFHNMQIYLSRGRCKATNSFSKHQAALLYFLLYKMHYLKKKDVHQCARLSFFIMVLLYYRCTVRPINWANLYKTVRFPVTFI